MHPARPAEHWPVRPRAWCGQGPGSAGVQEPSRRGGSSRRLAAFERRTVRWRARGPRPWCRVRSGTRGGGARTGSFDGVGGGGDELVGWMVLVLVVVVVVLAVGWVQVSCDGSGVLLWWSHAVFIKSPPRQHRFLHGLPVGGS